MNQQSLRLEALMETGEVTQEDVAEAVGVSQSTVARWLAGAGMRPPQERRLQDYLDRRGVPAAATPTYVETYPGEDPPPRSPETRLASACDGLGAGLAPLADRLGKIAAEGIDPGPPATEAIAALDKLLTRLSDFSGAIEDLRNEIVGD